MQASNGFPVDAKTPCATPWIALDVSKSFGTGEGKKPYQRALMASREAMAERAEIFVHQLQEDLARCSSTIDVMGALLTESTGTLRYF